MPRECLAILKRKSKVRYSRDKPVVAKVSTNASSSGVSPDVAELKDMVKALLLDKKAITADNFELKHGLLTLVQNKQFYGLDKEDTHAHIHYFNKITSTLKFPNFDTFYNALNSKDQDSLNSAAEGNFLDKMPRVDCLSIIESKSKVRYSRDKPVVAKVSVNASTFGVSPDVIELKDMVRALLLDKKGQNQSPAPVKAVEESFVTCSGAHSYRNCPATDGIIYCDNIQEYVSQASAVNYN
nr:hypothetical protein [Tanacetum cinerariifolium]